MSAIKRAAAIYNGSSYYMDYAAEKLSKMGEELDNFAEDQVTPAIKPLGYYIHSSEKPRFDHTQPSDRRFIQTLILRHTLRNTEIRLVLNPCVIFPSIKGVAYIDCGYTAHKEYRQNIDLADPQKSLAKAIKRYEKKHPQHTQVNKLPKIQS